MKKTTEINPQRSEKYRLWENFRFIPMLIILCSITLIASTISWIKSDQVEKAANDADRRSTSLELRFETELQRMALEFDRELRRSDEKWSVSYNEMEREYRLTQMEIDNFKITMNKAGLDVGHIGEKP